MTPAFIIPKKNGTIRLVKDYRRLDEITEKDPFPVLSILDLIYKVKKGTVFSQLDLNNRYYQIIMN